MLAVHEDVMIDNPINDIRGFRLLLSHDNYSQVATL